MFRVYITKILNGYVDIDTLTEEEALAKVSQYQDMAINKQSLHVHKIHKPKSIN